MGRKDNKRRTGRQTVSYCLLSTTFFYLYISDTFGLLDRGLVYLKQTNKQMDLTRTHYGRDEWPTGRPVLGLSRGRTHNYNSRVVRTLVRDPPKKTKSYRCGETCSDGSSWSTSTGHQTTSYPRVVCGSATFHTAGKWTGGSSRCVSTTETTRALFGYRWTPCSIRTTEA